MPKVKRVDSLSSATDKLNLGYADHTLDWLDNQSQMNFGVSFKLGTYL
jgi:hypothetical protein